MASELKNYVKWGKKKWEITDWFSPNSYVPDLPGDYQVGAYPNDVCSVIIWWDGKQWCYPFHDRPRHKRQDWWFRGWTGRTL